MKKIKDEDSKLLNLPKIRMTNVTTLVVLYIQSVSKAPMSKVAHC